MLAISLNPHSLTFRNTGIASALFTFYFNKQAVSNLLSQDLSLPQNLKQIWSKLTLIKVKTDRKHLCSQLHFRGASVARSHKNPIISLNNRK